MVEGDLRRDWDPRVPACGSFSRLTARFPAVPLPKA